MSKFHRRELATLVFAIGLFWLDLAHAQLADTVARFKPSVLLVGTYAATDSPRFGFRGTGFIVAAGNLAITNAHVLPATEAESEGRRVAVQVWHATRGWDVRLAKVMSLDREHDLALLQFEGLPGPPVTLADSLPREGANIAFMGFPLGGALGFSHVTHRGIISSMASMALPTASAQRLNTQAVRQLRGRSFEIFQLDATAYPGNSGGPIFDPENGAVLGVINSVFVKGSRESALTQPSGISYGIPVEHVRRLLAGGN